MSERKYTDEEIVKALECCINADCLNCPHWSDEWYSGMCIEFLKSVLDLINRKNAEIAALTAAVDNSTKEFLKLHDEYQDQKKEIERLKADVRICESEIRCERIHRGMARAEAVKEFAKKLKETPIELGLPLLGLLTKSEIEGFFNHTLLQVRDAIDNLVAEMTEGK